MQTLEFQNTARRLLAGTTEGDWRSAMSRSYYYIFHYFREFCLTLGLDIGQAGQAHNNLYVGLNNCGEAVVFPIASRISRLRDARNQADYELALTLTQMMAQKWVVEADAIIADFRRVLATTPAQSIVDGARKHLKAIGRVA